jgi:hypothetical protein
MSSAANRPKGRHVALRGAIALASLSAAVAVAGCSSTIGFDAPFADYLERTPLVSTMGGDAQAANIAIQTPTPWPRHSNDTNIPVDGARMTAVIKRYEGGSTSASEGATPTGANAGGNAGAGSTNGASTGMTASPPGQPSGY